MFWIEFGGFCFQIFLIWIAFLVLQCTVPLGVPKFKYKAEFLGSKTVNPNQIQPSIVTEKEESRGPINPYIEEQETVILKTPKKRVCLSFLCCFCPAYPHIKGGRLFNFLLWDIFSFLISLAYILIIVFAQTEI